MMGTRKVVKLATEFGPIEAEVHFRKRGLVLHRSLAGDGWVITHERSGRRLRFASFKNAASAKRALIAIEKVTDWRRTRSALLKGRVSLNRKIFEALRKSGVNP